MTGLLEQAMRRFDALAPLVQGYQPPLIAVCPRQGIFDQPATAKNVVFNLTTLLLLPLHNRAMSSVVNSGIIVCLSLSKKQNRPFYQSGLSPLACAVRVSIIPISVVCTPRLQTHKRRHPNQTQFRDFTVIARFLLRIIPCVN